LQGKNAPVSHRKWGGDPVTMSPNPDDLLDKEPLILFYYKKQRIGAITCPKIQRFVRQMLKLNKKT